MKKISLQIASFFMALVFLMSTFSFTIINHYCSDAMVSSDVISTVDQCDIEESILEDVCCDSEELDCCFDVFIPISGQDELLLTSIDYSQVEKQIVFVPTYFANTFNHLIETKIPDEQSYYMPPDVVVEAQLLFQVFRI